jgi:hypothetical protein
MTCHELALKDGRQKGRKLIIPDMSWLLHEKKACAGHMRILCFGTKKAYKRKTAIARR